MPAALHRLLAYVIALFGVAVAASVVVATHNAAAETATGTVSGRVLWGACIRALPVPLSPDAQPAMPPAPAVSDSPEAQSGPGARPQPFGGLPAGAVLVAVQNTAVSARTDEAGRFTLADVPAGQYLTVAAGPVANSSTAVAERPNVFVSGGQSLDVGTLSLGGQSAGLACRILPGAAGAAGVDGAPPDAPNP